MKKIKIYFCFVFLLGLVNVKSQNISSSYTINFYSTDSLGVSRLFYENGGVEKEGKFIYYRTFMLTPFKPYFSFKIKKQYGIWTTYYENGQVKMRGNYREGKMQGLWVYYNEKGELLEVSYYDKDKIVDTVVFKTSKENRPLKELK